MAYATRPIAPASTAGHASGMYIMLLPESGDLLVIWPDGRAVRIAPDGSTVPPLEVLAETYGPPEPRSAACR